MDTTDNCFYFCIIMYNSAFMKKHLLIFFISIIVPQTLFAQGDYYKSIDGVSGGESIKTALFNLIKEHKQIAYGTGVSNTWGAFYTTDAVIENGKRRVLDMYSDSVRYFGSKGASVSGMNIEHSVAKSWWGGNQNNAYYDLHHLNPSDAEANSKKSNYPLAELTSVTWQNGVTFVGKANIAGTSHNAYEPCDEYKGDFARVFMYMFTCYQNLTWKYTWMNYEQSTYPTLKPWAVEMLLRWHKQDPVSQKERDRNNAVYAIQGNRNPYVDYPQLAHYVWGDSIDYVFHLDGTVSGGGGSDEDNNEGTGSVGNLSTQHFTLLCDASLLSVGDTIIIACGDVALSTEQRGNNRGITAVQIVDDKIVSSSSAVQKIVIEKGVSNGTYAFFVGSGYLYAASSSSNYLRTQATVDGNASWLITIEEDGNANIVAQGNNSRNILRYNPSADIFSCYKSGQNVVKIYAKSPVSTAVESVGEDEKIVRVYNLVGQLVRTTSSNNGLNNLPPGVYIVNNRKVLVR